MAAFVPVAVLATARLNATDARCYDPAGMPLSQRSRRRTIGYIDKTSGTSKRCGTCGFFKKTAGDCGSCDLLSGGPVSTGAVCNSYAPLKS
jgi:hypothetical protein